MIPEYLKRHKQHLQNFSLHFDRFTCWDDKFKADIKDHVSASAGILSHAGAELKAIHGRQQSILEQVGKLGGFAVECSAELRTPYVSGLGGCHPTETGFILDRNTGLPYIPASGIKGVLRLAHALDIAKQYPERIDHIDDGAEISDRETSLRKYFGDTNTSLADAVRGQLVFLDAFPLSVPQFKLDIMNPHFGAYYEGKVPPRETENPVPVLFMTVAEGVKFIFRIFALPLADDSVISNRFEDDDHTAVVSMLTRACTELGFGGKTSVGYGRFATPVLTTAQAAVQNTSQSITWPTAHLFFTPGSGRIVTASFEGKRATLQLTTEAEKLFPTDMLARLTGNRREAKGKATVELIGGNNYRIVKVEAL